MYQLQRDELAGLDGLLKAGAENQAGTNPAEERGKAQIGGDLLG